MLEENKKKSVEYWDKSAKSWKNKAYSPDGNLTIFPSSQIRNEIVIKDLLSSKNFNSKILDIGCADGRLIRDMLNAGFTEVVGIDNSIEMIAEAKAILKIEFPNLNPDKIFFVADADDISIDNKFDYVSAIGLIEYVKDVNLFLSSVENLLEIDGIAYIESRNKLFNLVTANDYTLNIDSPSELIHELDAISHLSPVQGDDKEKLVLETYQSIGECLNETNSSQPKEIKIFNEYPFNLPQYTPNEIVEFCSSCNLNVEEVVYYHCHPFAPRFGVELTQLFNQLGVLMQPLGYTDLGALICSAFVAKVKKISKN